MFKNGQLLLLAVLSCTYTSRIFSQLANFENWQRDAADPATLTKSIAAAVQSVDPNLPLAYVHTMDQVLDESRAGDRFQALLFGGFAAIAQVLAALGIYGVMSFAVAQRTHEIGLRMALGARRENVMRLIIREGMILAIVGLVLGCAGADSVGAPCAECGIEWEPLIRPRSAL